MDLTLLAQLFCLCLSSLKSAWHGDFGQCAALGQASPLGSPDDNTHA